MSRNNELLFEDAVFSAFSPGKSRKASPINSDASFSKQVEGQLLNLSTIKRMDGGRCRVAAFGQGYRLSLSRERTSKEISDYLNQDNPDVNLQFTDDLLNFQPSADLVKKSKIPLWVIQHTGPQSVMIQRMW